MSASSWPPIWKETKVQSFWGTAAVALWLGVLTALHPCPMAGNVVAISFLTTRGGARRVVEGGILYGIGRAAVYVLVGILLVSGLLAAPAVSRFLQLYLNKLLGPLLVLVGMVLLDMLPGFTRRTPREIPIPDRARAGGLWSAGLLGIVFALSFCPVSAFLFFGTLVPMAIKTQSPIILPLLYGLGTALPIVGLAVAASVGVRHLAGTIDRARAFERVARAVSGLAFIGLGIHQTLTHIFNLSIQSH